MRCLVAYHSRSGKTRKLAERIAQALSADVVEVRTARYGRGFLGYLRAGRDSMSGRLPEIEADGPSLADYDFVMVMAPIWAGRAATPMRAYLAQNRGKFGRVAFVLTCGGWHPKRAFTEMAELAGTSPEASYALTDRDRKDGAYVSPELDSLVAALHASKALKSGE